MFRHTTCYLPAPKKCHQDRILTGMTSWKEVGDTLVGQRGQGGQASELVGLVLSIFAQSSYGFLYGHSHACWWGSTSFGEGFTKAPVANQKYGASPTSPVMCRHSESFSLRGVVLTIAAGLLNFTPFDDEKENI